MPQKNHLYSCVHLYACKNKNQFSSVLFKITRQIKSMFLEETACHSEMKYTYDCHYLSYRFCSTYEYLLIPAVLTFELYTT